jgi:capsular exopolysaccharide synthesis family protein
MEFNTSRETTLRDYLRVVFRHKIIFFILPLAIMIPVYISLEFKTPVYESSVKMYIKGQKQTPVDYYSGVFPRNITEEHAQLVKSNIVLERVVKALKLYQIPLDYEKRFASRIKAKFIEQRVKAQKQKLMEMTEEKRQAFLFQRALNMLKSNISALPEQNTSFFNIKVKDFNPVAAAVIANSVARSYVIFDLEQQIAELKLEYGEKHSTVVKLEEYIEDFRETLDGRPLPDIEAIGPASVKIVKQAEVGELSRRYKKWFLLFLSFMTSIFLGVVLSFIFDYFDQTFKTPRDIEIFLKMPFLGSIPRKKSRKKLLSDINPETFYMKAYQNLSEKLSLLLKDENIKAILFTDSEGKKDLSVVTANIGICLSHKTGYKVLIIDANLRQPMVSKIFKISNNSGLADILEMKASLSDTIKNLGGNLYILPSGETALNPPTVFSSPAMSNVVNKVKEDYDVVLIVCPDLKNYTDAVIISSLTDGIVLVINEGKVRRQVVENSLNPLRQKKTNVIGAILNNRRYVIPEIIYKFI